MLKYKSLVNHLAADDFIKTKDNHVAIRLAICIAELLRLLAPLNPFDEVDRMKVNENILPDTFFIHAKNIESIFQVILDYAIRQLKGLGDPSSSLFKHCYSLLDILRQYRLLNVINEIGEESETLMVTLMKMMFYISNNLDSDHFMKLHGVLVILLILIKNLSFS